MSPLDAAHRFAEAINSADLPALAALMTEDHRFIDAAGTVQLGRELMTDGWRQYLAAFPDYRIEIEEGFAQSDTENSKVALFGWASGSFQGKPATGWRIPCAWKALIREGQVAEWHVFSDIEPMLRSMSVNRFGS